MEIKAVFAQTDGDLSADFGYYVSGDIEIKNQNKTVTPLEEEQQITCDSGYTGLGTVTVLPVRTEQLQITENGTYMPPDGMYFDRVTASVPSIDSMIDGSFSGVLTSGAGSVKNYGISNLPNLTGVMLPSAVVLNSTSVASNNKLQRVDLGAATRIDASAFAYSRALDTLIIRTGAVCALTSDTAFRGTKIEAGTGYIYVPSVLLEQYKAATNWAVFADQFRTLEEVPA